METIAKPSKLQLILLRALSEKPIEEATLSKMHKVLMDDLVKKLDDEVERVWKEKGYTEATLEEWLNGHYRTPYKSK